MDIHLTDAELEIMNILWEQKMRAIDIAKIAKEKRNWNNNTTYTLINRLIKKGAVERTDPGFNCTALVNRETVCRKESKVIVDKLFNKSLSLFTKSFLEDNKLSHEELEELRKIINNY